MAWAAVNKDGVEFIYEHKPTRSKNYWEPAIIGQRLTVDDWGMKNMKILVMIILDFLMAVSRSSLEEN